MKVRGGEFFDRYDGEFSIGIDTRKPVVREYPTQLGIYTQLCDWSSRRDRRRRLRRQVCILVSSTLP